MNNSHFYDQCHSFSCVEFSACSLLGSPPGDSVVETFHRLYDVCLRPLYKLQIVVLCSVR